MRALKLLIATGVVSLGVLAAVVLTAGSATAGSAALLAPTYCEHFAYHPTDNSWTCEADLEWYRACDYHVDGHRVRGHIDVTGSHDHRFTAWAPSQGCTGWASTAYGGGHVDRIRSCTEHEGCSAWKNV